MQRRFLHPVLATFAYALPVALQSVDAPTGSTVHLHVAGEAGGDWSVACDEQGWRLVAQLLEIQSSIGHKASFQCACAVRTCQAKGADKPTTE
jgi:hypothetical protein